MKDALTLMKDMLDAFFNKNDESVLDKLDENIVICGLADGETLHGVKQVRHYLANSISQSLQKVTYKCKEENRISDSNAYLKFSITHGEVCVPLCVSGVATIKDGCAKLSFLHFASANAVQTKQLFENVVQKKAEETSNNQFNSDILKKMNGDLCTYAFDEAKHKIIFIESTYQSGQNLGISKEQYEKHDDSYGFLITHPNEKERVWNYLEQVVKQNITTSFTFRIADGRWLNAACTSFGKRDSLPLLRILFTPVSIMYDLQLQALQMDNVGIYIIDADTKELYFVNNTTFKLWGIEPCDYLGKTCHQLFWDCNERCEWCFLNNKNKETTSVFEAPNGKTLTMSVNQKEWNGQRVLVFCARDITKEQTLRKKVNETNEKMQELIENIPSGVCMYRYDGTKLERLLVGQGFADVFGIEARKSVDASQMMIYQVVHPDDLPTLRSYLGAFLKSKKDTIGFHQYRAWNEEKQEYIWVSAHAKIVHQNDGTSLLYVVYTNETEQVVLKNNLAATRNAINAAVKYGRLGIWTYDLTTGIISQDLSDADAYGYDNHLNHTPESFVAEKAVYADDAQTYMRCYKEIDGGAEKSECVVRTLNLTDNKYHWTHLYLMRQPDIRGKNPTAIGMCFDINQEITNYEKLNDAQAQLRQEKQVIDDLFENLPGGVVMLRWDGKKLKPIYVSNRFSEFYGEDDKDILARTNEIDYDVVHPDDLPMLKAFIEDNVGKTRKNMVLRYRVWNKKQKEYIWLQLTASVKRMDDGTSIVYSNYADVDAEVKAAEKLEKEENLLETTCRMANIWTFRYNLKEKRAYLSRFLQEAYNLPAIIDNYPEDFFKYPVILEESRELYRQMVKKVDAGENATTEMPSRRPDGSICYVRFEWHVIRQEDGKTAEVAGLALDITNEMAERVRFENERKKMLGGDRKLTGYSITNLQTRIVEEAQDYYLGSGIKAGDTCEELSAKLAPFIYSDKDRKHFLEMRDPQYEIRQFEAGITEWTQDMQWTNSSGHIRWQRSVYSVIENNHTGVRYLYCYLYDVLAEKMMQALFAGIQKNLYLSSGIISFESGQMYTYEGDYQNRQLSIVDYDEARKKYITNEVIDEDANMVLELTSSSNIKKQLASDKQDFSFVHRKNKDGKILYYELRYAIVPEETDIYILIIRDVTELIEESEKKNVELQKALAAAESGVKAKSEFLSRMSHEIRTPMNAIMGMTAIALDNKSDFLQVSDCLNKIDSSSKYLLTLINDILEMSRIESGRAKLSKEEFNFVDLITQIRTVAEPLANKSEIRLDVTNTTNNGNYYGDYIRIQQIMINLLGNAIKFTKPLGRVRFAVNEEETTDTKTMFEFTVEDTGIGMSEEFMEKMFEPFSQEDSTTTSRYGGSGLGLAISKSLVEAMGGTITAESMVGIGTNFTVCIPLEKVQIGDHKEKKKEQEIPEAELNAILLGKNILMAEDHPLNTLVAKKILEQKGIIVTVAVNGKVAVETFAQSVPNEFDAILMDIRMPIMDGLEASRIIRAMDRPDAKTIPIIAMTANALEEDRKNTQDVGMNEHLAKPIEPNVLYQTLAKQIMEKIK